VAAIAIGDDGTAPESEPAATGPATPA
jgi:hypothetical protein